MSHRPALALLALSVPTSATQCRWDTALRPGRTTCPLPPDDVSPADLLASSPLQPLKCLRPGGVDGVPCIYSAPSFRDGIIIATASSRAANLVGMGSLDGPVAPYTSQHLFSPGAVDTGLGPAYEVRDVPGKGKGVVAAREIRGGEVFMVDHPALLVEGPLMAGMNGPSRRGLLRGAVAGLGDAARERVLGLARSGGGDELLDVFVTNGCGVDGFGTGYTGLFPEVARMNHDCQPNAYFRFSARTMTMEVLAYRDILPGEEVTINYAFLGMPYRERQEHLRETWSFTCTCPLCTSSADVRETSDARRHGIARLRRELSRATEEGRWGEVGRASRDAIGLCEEEGLVALIPEFEAALARGYLELGEPMEAQAWGDRALEGRWVFGGERAVEEAEELIRVIEAKIREGRQE